MLEGKRIKLIHSYDRLFKVKPGDIGVIKKVAMMQSKHGGINAKRARKEDRKIMDIDWQLKDTGEIVSSQVVEGLDIYEIIDG